MLACFALTVGLGAIPTPARAAAPPAPAPTTPLAGVAGTDGTLWTTNRGGGGFTPLGGALTAAPAMAFIPAPAGGSSLLFVGTGLDHNLYVRSTAAGWRPLSSVRLYCIDNPAVAVTGAPGATVLYVACQGSDHQLAAAHAAVSPNTFPSFGAFTSLGGVLSAGPAVTTVPGSANPWYFVAGTDGHVFVRTDTNGYSSFSAFCHGHPAAGSFASTAYFGCQGLDGQLWYAHNGGSGWDPAQPAGGRLIDGPGVSVSGPDATFYVEGTDRSVFERTVAPQGPVSGWIHDGGVAQFGVGATGPTGLFQEPFTKFVIDATPPGGVIEKTFADINGDGRLDAVIGTEPSPNLPGSQGGIFWYQYPASGDPSQMWTRHLILSDPAGQAYEDMTALDVNHDGRVDIIAGVDGGLYWFENPGSPDGAWAQHLIGPAPFPSENTLTIGDFDGDGKLDIATNATIYFQNSPTSWTPVQINSGSALGSAALDIGSGMGRINLVGNSMSGPPYNIVWLENPREHGGNARTGAWVEHIVGPGYVCSGGTGQCSNGSVATVATGELNGDGRMDIVVGQSEGSPSPPGGLKWYAAPADRTQAWTKHDIDTSFEATHNLGVADINGDGSLDLVAGEQDQSVSHRIAVFYNDGAGNFTEKVISNDGSHNVALGDTTGDGDIDILTSPHGYFGGAHPLELFVNGRF